MNCLFYMCIAVYKQSSRQWCNLIKKHKKNNFHKLKSARFLLNGLPFNFHKIFLYQIQYYFQPLDIPIKIQYLIKNKFCSVKCQYIKFIRKNKMSAHVLPILVRKDVLCEMRCKVFRISRKKQVYSFHFDYCLTATQRVV